MTWTWLIDRISGATGSSAPSARRSSADDVGVHEVPLDQDRETAALADLDRSTSTTRAGSSPKTLAAGCARPEPMLVDGARAALLAGGHLAGLGAGRVEEARRVGTPGHRLVARAAGPVGKQPPGLDLEHLGSARRASPPTRLARTRRCAPSGDGTAKTSDLVRRPGVRVEHRLERRVASRAAA